jgi:nudix-type nucleoside diphosphatase (YffH/AdpP family)
MSAPQILALTVTHKRWSQMRIAELRLADGTTFLRDVEDHGDAVAVLPYDPARRVALLIRQFRTPPFVVVGDGTMLELPAGRQDEDDPLACARRELMEEVGLRAGTLVHVASVWTMPGLSTERAHLYLAPYSPGDRVAAGGGLAEEQEEIEVVELSLPLLAEMADAGRLTELKTLTLVQTLRLREPALFQTQ